MHVWWFVNFRFPGFQKFVTAFNNSLVCLQNFSTDVSLYDTLTSFNATFQLSQNQLKFQRLVFLILLWIGSRKGNRKSFLWPSQQYKNRGRKRLCIKVGRRQGDGDIGTRVWGLLDARRGTWGHQVWDVRTYGTGTRGRQIQGRGIWIIIAKVGGKCDISFFVKMCYLWSTLDSIFQNHIGHLLMFTQNMSL